MFSSSSNRDADRRASAAEANEKGRRRHHGIGIAMVALIDSTVMVTTRQSDNVPIASEVAMAPSNREEATGARLPSKPAAPGNRIMLKIPVTRNESPAVFCTSFAALTGNIAAAESLKMAKRRQRLTLCPLLLTFGGLLAGK